MSPADLDEATLTKTIEDIVVLLYQKAQYEDLTVKRVRARAEKQLDLPQNYLKTNPQWKPKSEKLIKNAAENFSHIQTEYTPEPPSDNDNIRERAKAQKEKEAKAKAAAAAEFKASQKDAQGRKRKAAAPAQKATPQKRAKKVVTSDEEGSDDDAERSPSDIDATPRNKKNGLGRARKVITEDSEDEDEDSAPVARVKTVQKAASDSEMSELEDNTPPPKKNGTSRTKKAISDSEMSELEDDTPPPKKKAGRRKRAPTDSEMSELEDDPPRKKARGRTKKTSSPSQTRAHPGPKPRKASAAPDTPSEAEIKRLQGWLNKCGMRKGWHRERAKYDTSKEYIQHLKAMLSEAGMTGKFSAEKAQQIKANRELAQEIKAAQDYNSWWGQGEDAASIGRPRRAAARAAGTLKLETPKFSDDEEGDEEEEQNDDDDEDVKMSDVEDGGDDEGDDGKESESEGSAAFSSDDFSD